jgi:hypothetical protein
MSSVPSDSVYLYGFRRSETPPTMQIANGCEYQVTLYCTRSAEAPCELNARFPVIQEIAHSYFSSIDSSWPSPEPIIPEDELVEKFKSSYPPDQLTEEKMLQILIGICALQLLTLYPHYDNRLAVLLTASTNPDFVDKCSYFATPPISEFFPLTTQAKQKRFSRTAKHFTFSAQHIEASRKNQEAERRTQATARNLEVSILLSPANPL